ncbi:peptidoglycan-binding protein [bacterium]|nr:peptidoglycan-binding protein [bacterium]
MNHRESHRKPLFAFPTLKQWGKLFNVLSKNEKRLLFLFAILAISSSTFLAHKFYINHSSIVPTEGGFFIEGIVGQPALINPIYAPLNDVDRDLVEILFPSLMKYNQEGKIVKDLAKDLEIKENGKIYEFSIKDNVFWSDGEKVTVDDIIFTVKTVQNSDYRSPLRAEWLGIDVEKISEYKLRFKLQKASPVFLEATTLKILPKHIWQNISPEKFPLDTLHNLQPVGSGPYKVESIKKDPKTGFIESITLKKDENYLTPSYIPEIQFKFFKTEKELLQAAKRGEIDSFSLSNFENIKEVPRIFSLHSYISPRYFAVFFNPQKAKILEDQNIRKALNLATDKEAIIEEVLSGYGKKIDSPLMPEIYEFATPSVTYNFDLKKAIELLEETGFKDYDGDGFREKHIKKEPAFQFKSTLKVGSEGTEVQELQKCLAKDPEVYPEGKVTGYFGQKTKQAVIKFQEKYASDILEPLGLSSGTGRVGKSTRKKLNEICFPPPEETIPLTFSLVTVNQDQLIKVAQMLKEQWQKIGVNLEIKTVDLNTLETDFIKPRNYQSILFGEALRSIPDPFPFWHSSQKKDPGLNLAIYENKQADILLEKIRETSDSNIQKENLEKLQDILLEDAPAVFLYSPDYVYFTNNKIKGVQKIKFITDLSKRFLGINNWYITTKRVWNFLKK